MADGSPSGGPRLSSANGVWVEQTLHIKASFKHVLDNVYNATCKQVDFQKKSAEIVNEVNFWAENQTSGIIKNILSTNAVDSFTKLIFANAVYFKGVWKEKFDPVYTKYLDFNLIDGSKVKVPFMRSYEEQLVREYDGFKVLGLPYSQGEDRRRFTMYLYLPNEKDGLPYLIEKMGSESNFLDNHTPHHKREVGQLLIPKFKIPFEIKASNILKELGLVLPFTGGEGLTEIADPSVGETLRVSGIYHKSFVEVNEEGTEAAAVTVGVIESFCLERVVRVDFIADHPFLFVIKEDTSGAVLFMGQNDFFFNVTVPPPPIPPPPISTRTSTRTKKLPTKLNDYHHKLPKTTVNHISKHHFSNFINYNNIQHNPHHRHLINTINHTTEPHTYNQAAKDPKWVEAISKEIQALESNGTWEITLLPPDKQPIGCKWVFRIKYHAYGRVEKFKARIVAKGFTQKEGIDYKETFAPVVQMVYMTIPQGYAKSVPPNTVCKLKKSLYGLKQANRQWFTKLTDLLLTLGFVQSYADTSLFTLTSTRNFTVLLLYVDGIILAGNNQSVINTIKQQLNQAFRIKDLGPLHYYLGIEFLRNSDGIAMTQRKTLVGKLIYLTITRPDLSFAAQHLSQFSHDPRTTHMKALIRVLRYIKLSPGQGLYFPSNTEPTLQAYCDSDWAAFPTTRRSISGYVVFLGKCLISWVAKKQSVFSRSSTEAEYRSLADCTCEISWLKCLFKDLHITLPSPIQIKCDNASTIALRSNPVHHARTQNIELDCHFVRDKIKEGSILPTFIPSRLQAADVLTKGLCKIFGWKQNQNTPQNNSSNPPNRFQSNGSSSNRTFNNNPSNNYGSTNNLEGMMSKFMASQEARMAKFESEFNQQQTEMTNKIDNLLKAFNNQGVPSQNKDARNTISERKEEVKKVEESKEREVEEVDDGDDYFDRLSTKEERAYHKDLFDDTETPYFLGNPIIKTGNPSNISIPCNIGHLHVWKAYIDLKSPINIMTRAHYNLIMKKQMGFRTFPSTGWIGNFVGRVRGLHVYVGNFTYVIDFVIVEDIRPVVDACLTQAVFGKPFVEASNMNYDPSLGIVRFKDETNDVAYQMPYKIEQYRLLSNIDKEHKQAVYYRNDEDRRRGVDYVMSRIFGFYKECLQLGPEYKTKPEDDLETVTND
ncbi:serpin [Artemisia annua]|uniref:Serpin n=1 Tax=Artemisia annua TaxID=35608 RepID=A0A2U1MFE7_ARTAN|nr:serpin [Artemisia annua]